MSAPTTDTPYSAAADTIVLVMSCDDTRALEVLRELNAEDLMSVRAAASVLSGLAADIQEERRSGRVPATLTPA